MAYQAHITCFAGGHNSVFESLEGGLGFTDSIRRLRVDVEMRQIYQSIVAKVCELVMDSVRLELHGAGEAAYVGSLSSLFGLDEELVRTFSQPSCLLQPGPL